MGSERTAVAVSSRNTRFDRCVFTGNRGDYAAGGVDLYHSGQEAHLSTFTSCRFINNSANWGGAVSARAASHNQVGGRIVIHNSEFIGNTSTANLWLSTGRTVRIGGALYNTSPTTTLEVTNCTFLDNETATEGPGEETAFCGIYSDGGPILFRNNACQNLLSESGAHVIYTSFDPSLGNATEHNASAWTWPDWGPTNVSQVPGFVDLLGTDGIRATGDEDLRLMAGSACADAGNSHLLPGPIRYDVGGEVRYFDDPLAADVGIGDLRVIDNGAHERQ